MISNALIILSTLCGPIIAVQVTRYLDDQKEVRERKLWVFKTLMATRAYTLSPQHVEALNRIDLEFFLKNTNEKQIVEKWREYLDLLGNKNLSPEQWNVKRVDLLVDLLYYMGKPLGYDFDKTQIKNGTYAPMAHGRIEEQQEAIRQGVIDIIKGEKPLPMFITNIHDNQLAESK